MKKVGLVILGLVASYAIHISTGYVLTKLGYIGYGCSGMGVGILVVLPISFLLGSIATGFFSYSVIRTKWELLVIVPGLYIMLPLVFCPLSNPLDLLNPLFFLFVLYFYSASLAGVGLGYLLRSLRSRNN